MVASLRLTASSHCIVSLSKTLYPLYWFNPGIGICSDLLYQFEFKGCWVVSFNFIQIYNKVILLANSAEPDQMLCSAASDLGLHCLSIIKGC